MGSRLGKDMPKCLVEVAGRSIISRQLELLCDVKNVFVVVGYLEEQVVSHVKAIRPDAIIVRNPNFSSTQTSQSLYLASTQIQGPFLAMDGDVVLEPSSFSSFLGACKDDNAPLMAFTKATTEQAVYLKLRNEISEGNWIEEFSRTAPARTLNAYEWPGITWMKPEHLTYEKKFLYSILEKYLPIRGHYIQCAEVDTPADLSKAVQLVERDWSEPTIEIAL